MYIYEKAGASSILRVYLKLYEIFSSNSICRYTKRRNMSQINTCNITLATLYEWSFLLIATNQ